MRDFGSRSSEESTKEFELPKIDQFKDDVVMKIDLVIEGEFAEWILQ